MLEDDRSGLVMVKAEPFNAETPLEALREPLTPVRHHYVRSNFALPAHPGTLAVGGAVERELTLTLDELRAMPAAELPVTLECAGNGRVGLMPLPTGEPWTGQAVGTATWTGVPLSAVLARANPRVEGHVAVFHGADHGPYKGGPDIAFERALPVEYALGPENDVLLAYGMNGEPLTPDHGAPLRLVVPGWYGMASVKWLSRITVQPAPFEAQFQTRSYVFEWAGGEREPVTRMRVRALITDPAPGAVLSRDRQVIRGKAWSGAAPVAAVEVSLTGGGEWQPAQLAERTAPYTWQEWSFAWEADEVGRHVLRARATDAAGNVQPDAPAWNRLGYGNNAAQVVVVDVR
jgi:DMSO/TMAO reductase YedYZ molybdopterin-dependent catalytic subunit